MKENQKIILNKLNEYISKNINKLCDWEILNLMDTKKKSQNENQNKPKINDFYLKYKEKWGIGKNKKSGI